MLLEALKRVNEGLMRAEGSGKCLVVITGKGPMKEAFEKSVQEARKLCTSAFSSYCAYFRISIIF
jgi:hypothetical protein